MNYKYVENLEAVSCLNRRDMHLARKNKIPVYVGYPAHNTFAFYCNHCQKLHHHSYDSVGHRKAHCTSGPLVETGYYLVPYMHLRSARLDIRTLMVLSEYYKFSHVEERELNYLETRYDECENPENDEFDPTEIIDDGCGPASETVVLLGMIPKGTVIPVRYSSDRSIIIKKEGTYVYLDTELFGPIELDAAYVHEGPPEGFSFGEHFETLMERHIEFSEVDIRSRKKKKTSRF